MTISGRARSIGNQIYSCPTLSKRAAMPKSVQRMEMRLVEQRGQETEALSGQTTTETGGLTAVTNGKKGRFPRAHAAPDGVPQMFVCRFFEMGPRAVFSAASQSLVWLADLSRARAFFFGFSFFFLVPGREFTHLPDKDPHAPAPHRPRLTQSRDRKGAYDDMRKGHREQLKRLHSRARRRALMGGRGIPGARDGDRQGDFLDT